MLSNNGSCLHMRSCAVRVTTFSNSSIILPGFKFTKLHALTLAARSYALLRHVLMIKWYTCPCMFANNALLGGGGRGRVGLENKERSKEDQRHY